MPKLGLNDSPFCTLHLNECICDLPYILFYCLALRVRRKILFNALKPLNIPFNLHFILNIKSVDNHLYFGGWLYNIV